MLCKQHLSPWKRFVVFFFFSTARPVFPLRSDIMPPWCDTVFDQIFAGWFTSDLGSNSVVHYIIMPSVPLDSTFHVCRQPKLV